MSTPERPFRAVEIELKVSGDSWRDALALLRHAVEDIEAGTEREINAVSGGYSAGHILTVTRRPDMTHDRYFEELNRYLNRKREPTT